MSTNELSTWSHSMTQYLKWIFQHSEANFNLHLCYFEYFHMGKCSFSLNLTFAEQTFPCYLSLLATLPDFSVSKAKRHKGWNHHSKAGTLVYNKFVAALTENWSVKGFKQASPFSQTGGSTLHWTTLLQKWLHILMTLLECTAGDFSHFSCSTFQLQLEQGVKEKK